MKRIIILLVCVLLVFSFTLSVSAAEPEYQRRIFYLYKDFEPVLQISDNSVLRRLTVDLSSMFWSVSSMTSPNFQRGLGGSIVFYGSSSDSYWANVEILGTAYPDINSDAVWNYNNLISLSGFESNSNLRIGYTLTGANIADDHHDIWIKYYDQQLRFTEQIQYVGQVSTTDQHSFFVDVDVSAGSNPNNSYFSIMVQIDDIIPTQTGTVSLFFQSCTLVTNAVPNGGLEWSPVVPDLPTGGSSLNQVTGLENELFDSLTDGFGYFVSLAQDAIRALRDFASPLLFLTALFESYMDLSWIGVVLSISVCFGIIGYFLNIGDGLGRRFSGRISRQSSSLK